MAQNGIAPIIKTASSFRAESKAIWTPPNAMPKIRSSKTMIDPKIILATNFAKKYANGGIGLARFTCIHPNPRSEATPTPFANREAPITPNVP